MDIKKIAKEEIRTALQAGFCFAGDAGLKDLLGEEVYGHSDRVCGFALAMADAYGFNLQEKIDLAVGSLLHDVGKAYVPQAVLQKPERLTRDERVLIEQHPHEGYRRIRGLDFNKNVIDIIHYHHERLDGSGYPEKYQGKKIGILTQIVSVADVYEALTAKRVYHEPYSPEKAFEMMEAQSGLNQLAVSILKKYIYKE